jgi:hypothetical protein
VKRLFILISLSIIGFWSNAQEVSKEIKMDRNIRDWTTLRTEDVFSVEFKYADCDPPIGYKKEIVQLKFTNKSDQKIELKWHVFKYFNNVCSSCDYPEEYTYSLILEPNKSISGDCAMECDPALIIFSRFIESAYKGDKMLTDFELHDLTFTVVK